MPSSWTATDAGRRSAVFRARRATKAGAESFRRLGTYCKKLGIDYLTVYAFSTENWKRPPEEIDGIMQLLRRYLHECIDTMERDSNRLRFLGDLSVLDDDLKELIRETNEISARIEGFQANVCLNYGGRDEIIHAARAFARDCATGEKRSDALTEEIFSQYLYSNGLPDPELLIRPGGEKRISNYLLWQCAYSEFYFCDTLWPDFDEREFDKALIAYQHRERRFGRREAVREKQPERGNTMKQRWLVVAIGLPLLLLVLLACPAWATMLLVCAIAGIAAYELLHTAGKNVPTSIYLLTVTVAAAYEVLLYYSEWTFFGTIQTVTVLRWAFLMLLFFTAVHRFGGERPFAFSTLCAAVVGGMVFPAMYSCIFLLRSYADFGRVYVLAPFFIAFAGDALSMYFGMWFGKRKMAPHVSPHKTWAGGIGGPIGSALAMLLLGLIAQKWLGYAPDYARLALVGAVANVFGQLGDLSMSLIKREAGIKDYSHLFLTHGGMLDRFDSTMFIAPVVYFFVAGGIL